MPAYSPPLLLTNGVSSSEIVSYNSLYNPSIISALLETSFLTMRLQRHHIHCLSDSYDLFSLDGNLAQGIWRVLKDLSRTIQEAADPTLDPFEQLNTFVSAARLREIDMDSPRILTIENYTQNLLLSATSLSDIHKLFAMAQSIGLETLEWIAEAKRRCTLAGDGHGWHWQDSRGELVVSGSQDSCVAEDRMIEEADATGNEQALILHPRYSTWALNHPKCDPCHPTRFDTSSRDDATEPADLEGLGVSELLAKLNI
jgi:hypothetical protein